MGPLADHRNPLNMLLHAVVCFERDTSAVTNMIGQPAARGFLVAPHNRPVDLPMIVIGIRHCFQIKNVPVAAEKP